MSFLQSKSHIEKAVAVLRSQNKIMANHPNGTIYKCVALIQNCDTATQRLRF